LFLRRAIVGLIVSGTKCEWRQLYLLVDIRRFFGLLSCFPGFVLQ
jgi:hypothetical protein